MEDISIQVLNLKKIYKIYNKPMDRFKESMSFESKSYHKDFYALADISFSVNRGEIYGIMGVNGSGKSTLLKIITGVLSASEGNVTVNGRISALLELGAGFNSEYTGIENIYLNGMMLGYSREEMTEKLETILSFADIGDFINQPVKTYSSGMFARLAFAVSINVDPDVLIVDEALSVGDYFFQAKCYKKFEEFKQKGKTILFVSHDMSSILKYCDRVLLLNNGKMVSEGSADTIINVYKRLLANQFDDSNTSGTSDKGLHSLSEDVLLKNQLVINPKTLEYGNLYAEIVDFSVEDKKRTVTSSILKGEEFRIYMKIRFNRDIEKPIFAFTIKDIKGTELIGTNTFIEENSPDFVKKNEVISVSFKQYMHLQGGAYLLSLGCTSYKGAELDVHHRLYDVCSITVISHKNTIGFYDCNSDIEIKGMLNNV